MSAKKINKRSEIDINLEYFQSKLPSLSKDHKGRYVLLRSAEIVGIYDTVRDAKMTGDTFFTDGIYSIQKVSDKPVDLGYFSHAMHLG